MLKKEKFDYEKQIIDKEIYKTRIEYVIRGLYEAGNRIFLQNKYSCKLSATD